MTQQHPNSGLGSEPGGRPDFAPAGPPPRPTPARPVEPNPGLYGAQAGYQPPPAPVPPPSRGRLPLIVAIGVLVVVLLVLTGFGLFKENAGLEDDLTPDQASTETAGEGTLPVMPTLDAPAVIDEVAEAAGLTCHDEATTAVKVRGCYLIEAEHLVNLRFRLTDDGEIDSIFTTVLFNDIAPTVRAQELLALLEPLLPTLPLTDADREAVVAAISGTESDVDGDTEWRDGEPGRFSYWFTDDTSTLSLGRYSSEFVPVIPLAENPHVVMDELLARDWTCEEDEHSFDCLSPSGGSIVGSISTAGLDEPALTVFRVWFDGQVPDPDEPRMIDAYVALAKAGEKGEALAIGLRMLAEGEKQFFNSDTEFYRGDSYYEMKAVQFN